MEQEQEIVKLRKQGISCFQIHKRLGLSRRFVSQICRQRGIEPILTQKQIEGHKRGAETQCKPEERYICQYCGEEYVRDPRRHGEDGKKYCSRECAYADIYKWKVTREKKNWPLCKVYFPICTVCGKVFIAKAKHQTCCSEECKNKLYEDNRRQRYGVRFWKKKCSWCGKEFITYYSSKEYCSLHCNRRDRNGGSNVRLSDLFMRYKGCCNICKKKLSLKNKVPHSYAPTIDHIIPISKGGEDVLKNCQLACFQCNCKKGNRSIEGGEQLKMFA